MATIVFNVSGRIFEIRTLNLKKKPNTRLGKLAIKVEHTEISDMKKTPIFIDRPSSSFESILSFYQTDELHMPSNVCPHAFKKELDYWRIDSRTLETCCRFKYLEFFNNHDATTAFYSSIKACETISDTEEVHMSAVKLFRNRLWSILDQKESTIISRIVIGTMFACVFLSVITLALGTVESFRYPLQQCELRDYLQDVASQEGFDTDVVKLLNSFNCSVTLKEIEDILWSSIQNPKNDNNSFMDYDDYYEYTFKDPQKLLDKLKKMPKYTKRQVTFVIIDFVLLSMFTVELILRVCSCPNIKRYFLSVMNVIDSVILLTTYADLICEYEFAKYRYEEKGFKIFYYLQMLRVLRVIRYIHTLPSIRVLGYTMKTNMKDLSVLFLFMLIGILIFSNFMYFAEDEKHFANIPQAWWWGIITMTTVGYGDIVPHSIIGRIIGSMCAVSGVLVLSLTIPVFVNTFVKLYNFSHLYERFLKNEKIYGERYSSIRPCNTDERKKSISVINCKTLAMNEMGKNNAENNNMIRPVKVDI